MDSGLIHTFVAGPDRFAFELGEEQAVHRNETGTVVLEILQFADALGKSMEQLWAPVVQPSASGMPSAAVPGLEVDRPVMITWSDGNRYPATLLQVGNGVCRCMLSDGRQVWVAAPQVAVAPSP